MSGCELIAEERARQINVEGWTPEHDDQHTGGQMARAAACYADVATVNVCDPECPMEDLLNTMAEFWPWDEAWMKPSSDPIRNLVKAGALIAAEIDRLQRRSSAGGQPQPAQEEP